MCRHEVCFNPTCRTIVMPYKWMNLQIWLGLLNLLVFVLYQCQLIIDSKVKAWEQMYPEIVKMLNNLNSDALMVKKQRWVKLPASWQKSRQWYQTSYSSLPCICSLYIREREESSFTSCPCENSKIILKIWTLSDEIENLHMVFLLHAKVRCLFQEKGLTQLSCKLN